MRHIVNWPFATLAVLLAVVCLNRWDFLRQKRNEAAFALARGVVVLLLFFCALLVSTLGLNFDLAISDLAQGDFHQSLVELTSALQKIWVDYFLRVLEQLFVQFPLLCTFVLSHWPWALLVLLVFLGLPLLVGMWAPMKTGCTMIQAMETSFAKLTHMSVHVVLPVALFYGDLVSDALVMSKFWQAQHYQYFTLNALAILAGLVTTSVIGSAGMGSASEALQPIRGCTAVLTFLHVIPLYCFFFAFWQFADAKFATYKSDAFDRRLRDKGLTALMASSIIGETFGEAMLNSFVQLYAALRHGPLQWPSLLACSAARPKASSGGGGQLATPLQAALISFSQLCNWLMPRWLKIPPTLPKRSQLVLQWTFRS